VRAVLCRRAVAVAREFAGDSVTVDELPAEGAPRAFVVSADVPRLSVAHLACAALDLDDGADASYGSTLDGAAYLLAMRETRADLLAHGPGGGPGPAGLAQAFAVASQAGVEIGLIRMERRLRTPSDAAAMLADPLLPHDVRQALEGPHEDVVA
jgi:glycosyltransferase A (GT-A) superfamily protein (DUF2064 family)